VPLSLGSIMCTAIRGIAGARAGWCCIRSFAVDIFRNLTATIMTCMLRLLVLLQSLFLVSLKIKQCWLRCGVVDSQILHLIRPRGFLWYRCIHKVICRTLNRSRLWLWNDVLDELGVLYAGEEIRRLF